MDLLGINYYARLIAARRGEPVPLALPPLLTVSIASLTSPGLRFWLRSAVILLKKNGTFPSLCETGYEDANDSERRRGVVSSGR